MPVLLVQKQIICLFLGAYIICSSGSEVGVVPTIE